MGDEPLELDIEGWTLIADVKDYGAQIAIVTNDSPPRTHYVRVSRDQAYELLSYLHRNVPLRADDCRRG